MRHLGPVDEDVAVQEEVLNSFSLAEFGPKTIEEFKGQDTQLEVLNVRMTASKRRGTVLPHTLIHGQSGCGKTTLAEIICREMGIELDNGFHIKSGQSLNRADALAATLISMNEGDILFIDEIHRINANIQEYLFPLMETLWIHIRTSNKFPIEDLQAASISGFAKPFTIIGATTRIGMLERPFLNRFQVEVELLPYSVDILLGIVETSTQRIGFEIDEMAARIIASRSRNTPRIAKSSLGLCIDFADNDGRKRISVKDALNCLKMQGLDRYGLKNRDRRYLQVLFKNLATSKIGLDSLAQALNYDDSAEVQFEIEPYLIHNNFCTISKGGRSITEKGYYAMKDDDRWGLPLDEEEDQ